MPLQKRGHAVTTPDIWSDQNILQNNLLCILGLVQMNLFWAHYMLTQFSHHHLVHNTPKLLFLFNLEIPLNVSQVNMTVAEIFQALLYQGRPMQSTLIGTWESHSWWQNVLLNNTNWWLFGWMLLAASGCEDLTDDTGNHLTPLLFYYLISRPICGLYVFL